MNVFANETERFRSGEGDMAAYLGLHDFPGAEAEGGGLGVAGLFFKSVPTDGATIEARRCPGLESAGPKAKSPKGLAEQD
jgi:hypothetical protein